MESLDQYQLDILEYLAGEGGISVPSGFIIAKALDRDVEQTTDDIVILVRFGLVEAAGSDSHPVRDCRFHLSQEGEAALAMRRKATRDGKGSTTTAAVAKRLIANGVTISRDKMQSEVRRVLDDCASRGWRTRRMIILVVEVVAREMRERADQAITTLGRVIEEAGERLTSEELRGIYNYATSDDMFGDARKYVTDVADIPGDPNAITEYGAAIHAVERQITEKVLAEIDLLAMKPTYRNVQQEPKEKSTVFVVHGRDGTLRAAMFDFLRSVGLRPLEWQQAVRLTKKPSPYVGEVIEAALEVAQAALILLTPDNEARLRPGLWKEHERADETEYRFHPRQNVLFEAGMAFGMAPNRTIILMAGNVLIASDIHGRNYLSFDGGPAARNDLVGRLRIAGCDPNTDSNDWLHSGNFPSYNSLAIGSASSTVAPEPAVVRTGTDVSTDARAFAVQPILHLVVGGGMSGPSGSYLGGTLRNVGRGIARVPRLTLPGFGNVGLDALIKPGETVDLPRLRHDDNPCYTEHLPDRTVTVQFEDELGTVYQQIGEVAQNATPGGVVLTYQVNALGPVQLVR